MAARIAGKIALAAGAAAGLIAAAPPPTAEEIGPAPAYPAVLQQFEEAVRQRLIDPSSAQFEWPYGITGGYIKPLLAKRVTGWFTCGFVNSRNRLGGYVGRTAVEVVIRNDVVQYVEIGEGGDFDLTRASCDRMVKTGLLKPAQAVLRPPVPSPTGPGPLGVQFLPTAAGAVLIAVQPGSAADKAGLKVGQIVEAVNGASVKGMPGEAIAALIHAQAEPALSVTGQGVITVHLAPAP